MNVPALLLLFCFYSKLEWYWSASICLPLVDDWSLCVWSDTDLRLIFDLSATDLPLNYNWSATDLRLIFDLSATDLPLNCNWSATDLRLNSVSDLRLICNCLRLKSATDLRLFCDWSATDLRLVCDWNLRLICDWSSTDLPLICVCDPSATHLDCSTWHVCVAQHLFYDNLIC